MSNPLQGIIDAAGGQPVRVVRVRTEGDVRFGLADESTITLISDEPFAAWEPEGTLPLASARLVSPVTPTKVVCVGLNYRQHAEELGMAIPDEPVLFMKPATSVIGPHADIVVPDGMDTIDYEAELAVVIGRRTHKVTAEDAPSHVLGYMCANDVTARSVQSKDGQWTRAKSYDTFCPLGPWIATDVEDASDLAVESYLDGELKQSSSTSDMIWSPDELVSFASHVMTLLPGDVVLTGTPSGVGPMRAGQSIEIRIDGVGSLVNPVV